MSTTIRIDEEKGTIGDFDQALRMVTDYAPEGMVPHTLRLIPGIRSVTKHTIETHWAIIAVFRPPETGLEDRCHMQLIYLRGGVSKPCYPTWNLLLNRGPNYPKTVERFYVLRAELLKEELERAQGEEGDREQGKKEGPEN